jgi:hypothetical protein
MPKDSQPSDKFAPFPCARCGQEARCLQMAAQFAWLDVEHWKLIEFVCVDCRDEFKLFWSAQTPKKGTDANDEARPTPGSPN